ncbi:hypothetical protein CS0771_75280 [Catellatospora sp. IY07-71]|uniref:hypothetical protein n=1 Tax=Catellatospora sp. IY07-71 TaxID=2728827 RepID=UPI001BB3C65B|nr:hypothetical protein [Catellatospora sp. IY07-71]BCJ77984.1 hypothetical protein CS0771_75280 [Catellatospora sp. IY07-71]
MHIGTRVLLGVVTVVAAAAVLTGCAQEPDSAAVPGTVPGSSTGQFAQIDAATRELVTQRVDWQAPASLDVEQTARVGLSVGSGAELKSKVEALVPNAVTTPAGEMKVGPTVRASLRGNPEDVEITPAEAVNASTGSDVQMLWTWLIKPKHPTDALDLTAHLEVPLSNGHVITHEVPLRIEVHRTMPYTVWQVLTNWGTWSAVVTSLIGVVGWLIRRRRKQGAAGEEKPEASVAAPAEAAA